jgi:hypothetical protein
VADGPHTLHARARVDGTISAASSAGFTVVPDARVEWQVVKKNAAPAADAWRPADGLAAWRFTLATGDYGKGPRTVVVRLVGGGLELARSTARARFE